MSWSRNSAVSTRPSDPASPAVTGKPGSEAPGIDHLDHAIGDTGLAPTDPITGLSTEEANRRFLSGMANTNSFAASRTYAKILRDNALMSINVIIFGIGIALVLMGLYVDAAVTVVLVVFNILIAVIQESRAKRALDKIALLTRPRATVIRDGAECVINPAEIVLGDLVVAQPGDQIVVDGEIMSDGRVELDESLITGEAEPVAKYAADPVYSGTFSVSGRMVYETHHVGTSSLANRLTVRARVFKQSKTPVQQEVDLVLRCMVLIILVLGGPIVLDLLIQFVGIATRSVYSPLANTLDRAYQDYSVHESVRSAAVIVGLVPQGLALMLTVAYSLGALRLARKSVLLQESNAVESLSHVDVLCLDKTGTLTTNRLVMGEIQAIGTTAARLSAILADVAASTSQPNRTCLAIREAFPGNRKVLAEEVAFSSARKWSALSFDNPECGGAYVLGAPEVLLPSLPGDPALEARIQEWVSRGLRVLLLARAPAGISLYNAEAEPRLPQVLTPLGILSLRDELQPEAATSIARLARFGISLKIISGDHPETVAALARQAGFGRGGEIRILSGIELAAMTPAEMRQKVQSIDIFGRVTPDQKVDLIRYLQEAGHYVAMIGDGVNDVLALKQAEVGIAMETGSPATRAVADLTLLGNSFAAVPEAFREGQRIVRGAQDLLKLFLTRSLAVAIAIMGAGIVGAPFPVLPTHGALPSLLTIGIPTLALAAWAQPGAISGPLIRPVLKFTMPAALTTGAVESTLYITYLRATDDLLLARTMLATVAVLCGLLLILFVEPPAQAWTGGDELSGDRRPLILVGALFALFVTIMATPVIRDIFRLASLTPVHYAIAGLVVTAWAIGLRSIWRSHLLDRLLGID